MPYIDLQKTKQSLINLTNEALLDENNKLEDSSKDNPLGQLAKDLARSAQLAGQKRRDLAEQQPDELSQSLSKLFNETNVKLISQFYSQKPTYLVTDILMAIVQQPYYRTGLIGDLITSNLKSDYWDLYQSDQDGEDSLYLKVYTQNFALNAFQKVDGAKTGNNEGVGQDVTHNLPGSVNYTFQLKKDGWYLQHMWASNSVLAQMLEGHMPYIEQYGVNEGVEHLAKQAAEEEIINNSKSLAKTRKHQNFKLPNINARIAFFYQHKHPQNLSKLAKLAEATHQLIQPYNTNSENGNSSDQPDYQSIIKNVKELNARPNKKRWAAGLAAGAGALLLIATAVATVALAVSTFGFSLIPTTMAGTLALSLATPALGMTMMGIAGLIQPWVQKQRLIRDLKKWYTKANDIQPPTQEAQEQEQEQKQTPSQDYSSQQQQAPKPTTKNQKNSHKSESSEQSNKPKSKEQPSSQLAKLIYNLPFFKHPKTNNNQKQHTESKQQQITKANSN